MRGAGAKAVRVLTNAQGDPRASCRTNTPKSVWVKQRAWSHKSR